MQLVYREEPQLSDVQAIRSLTAGTGFFRPDEVDVAVELVEERLAKGVASGYYFWFADAGSELAGYVCFGPIPCTLGSFDLYWIAVGKRWQGCGLGRELTRKTENTVRLMGGRNLYIETAGKDLYGSTRAFYEQMGYFQAAEMPDFYDIGDSKIIFQKKL